ncbi:MAG: methionyl-tRNA formyltransferase [Candidatus Buchananbacteria bacterium RBG_13_36_9]|uniref:Methionyl-tRNA formyltransferase n=1 Tax=Candidatus Buchananbacteria bacterium RBG_13_36_9 TaxID=1797530 RepID=A0A1G1XQZ1_9BACT|nr:MAG: methionyl-tRNA formyltransferase [Candidatus Buchananbacteria bacterium RBG_13_36_9]
MNLKDYKIIFMGTPDFGAPVFLALIDKFNIVAAVTQPDKKVGRKQEITQSPIKKIALKNKIEVLQPEKVRDNAEFIQRVKSLQPDLIIVVAYGFILPKEILEIPKFGAINIHASLLPKYRGASPIQTAILNGDKETGISIILIDDKMDHGPLLEQRTITINDNDNFESLHDKLAQLGADLLLDTLPKYISGEIKPVSQKESQATYCQLIKKEDGKIDWSKPAEEIERQIKSYTPWPGAFTFWEGKQLKFIKALVIKAQNQNIGEVFKINEGIGVKCGKDALEVLELQLESKKPMNVKEFLNGYPEIIGFRLS